MSKKTQPKFFSFPGFFQVTRIQNLFVIVITQYLAALYLIQNTESTDRLFDINLALIVISTVLIAAAGYLINDYYDVKIDLINKPGKVIVGTVLHRRSVILAHTLFNFTGIGLGAWADLKVGGINFLAAFVLWLYSNQLKRTPFFGNFVVAILAGTTVLVIGIFYNDLNLTILLYATFAFTSTLVREIVKDIEDLRGDRKFGSYTLPIALGIRKTKGILLFINASFLGFILYLIYSSSFSGPDFILYFFLAPIIFLSIVLIRADKRKDFTILSSLIKWFMLLGIFSIMLIHL